MNRRRYPPAIHRKPYQHAVHHRPKRNIAVFIQPYHKKFLSQAKKYLRDGQNEAALVFAQAASEIYTESALKLLFRLKGVASLYEALYNKNHVYDICKEQVRKVYTAISDDRVQKQQFWTKLKEFRELRHKVVH